MIEITEEEARIIISLLKTNWVPLEQQQVVYRLINRLEKALSN